MTTEFKSMFRPLFRATFFSLGFHAVRLTRAEDIKALIALLKPQDCGIEMVRLGGDHDGGYLVPNDLEGIQYCFSPGVGQLSLFEEDLAARKINSYLADYTVDAPPVHRPEFTFEKKCLGALDQGRYITLASWKDKYLKDYIGDLLLQMDIEGSEYEVILSVPNELLDQFRIIAIEFHDLDKLFDAFTFRIFRACFSKLLQYFYVVHIHPNNTMEVVKWQDLEIPRVMEFTFLNKRRAKKVVPQTKFPHILDADTESYEKHLVLPKCWYSTD